MKLKYLNAKKKYIHNITGGTSGKNIIYTIKVISDTSYNALPVTRPVTRTWLGSVSSPEKIKKDYVINKSKDKKMKYSEINTIINFKRIQDENKILKISYDLYQRLAKDDTSY